MPTSAIRGAVLALGLLLTACGAGPHDDEAGGALDADVDVFTATVTLEIGEAEGDAAYLFGRVSGLALDADGRIYVADGQGNEVRVFAPDGTHLFSFGRAGGGPGEMLRPCCLAFDRAGLLWLRDAGNARYNAYRIEDGGATYVRQIRMAHSDVNFGPPITFSADGHLIDIGHRYDPARDAATLYRLHLDSAGTVVREEAIPTPTPQELGAHIIERTSGNRRDRFYFWPPYGANHLVAHSPDGSRATAISSSYEVSWYTPDGELAHTIRQPGVTGPPVSPEEARRAEERIAAQLESVGAAPGDARFRAPERKPPLAGLFFDRAGRLWVRRSVAQGQPNEADVYAADGTLVARVTWPARIRLDDGFVELDRALGTTTDSLGVTRVARVEFLPAGNAGRQ